jgi:hypothetical protein
MAGRKIENAAIGAEDWTSEVESKNLLKKGYYNLSFTNMDNTSQPAIAAGSSVDIDGVLYAFDTEEAISGSPSDGVVYVTISGGVAATASFTNDALPEYDYIRKGYYGVSGERYVLKLNLSTGLYYSKQIITDQPNHKTVSSIFDIATNKLEVLSETAPIGSSFIASGDYYFIAGRDEFWFSTDCINWVNVTNTGFKFIQDIFYQDGEYYIACGEFGSSRIYKTTDLSSFNLVLNSSFGNGIKKIEYGNNIFVAVTWGGQGTDEGIIFSSADGTNWTQRLSTNRGFDSLYYFDGDGSTIFVAIAQFMDDIRIFYSTDGINWTTFLSQDNSNFQGTVFAVPVVYKYNTVDFKYLGIYLRLSENDLNYEKSKFSMLAVWGNNLKSSLPHGSAGFGFYQDNIIGNPYYTDYAGGFIFNSGVNKISKSAGFDLFALNYQDFLRQDDYIQAVVNRNPNFDTKYPPYFFRLRNGSTILTLMN